MKWGVFTSKTLSSVESPLLELGGHLAKSRAEYSYGDPMVVCYFAELVVG